ncbi:MAG: FtsQ-type POTRA domain-containing protein [Acidobacteriota bacterium]
MSVSEKVAKQTVVPRRRAASTRRMKPTIEWSGLRARVRLVARVTALLIGLALLVMLYRAIVTSPSFQLRTVDVSGNYRVNSAEIDRLVRQNISGTLLTTSLNKLQEQLQTLTWVKRARITRILPDTLRVYVEERQPLVLARYEAQGPLVWLDEEAVNLGEYDSDFDKELPPPVSGFTYSSGEAAQYDNLDRIELYKRLMWALDSGPVKYSQQVEEVDLANLKDIRLHVRWQPSRSPVEVDLGDRDFRARLVRALEVLDALQARDVAKLRNYQFSDAQILTEPERIRFISVIHPNQVAIRTSKLLAGESRAPADNVARAGEGR